MERLLRGLVAEPTVVTVILLNAGALFMMGFSGEHAALGSPWFAVDYACVLYFMLEVVLKARLKGWAAYWASPWNRFDFVVVVLSLPVLASPFVDLHDFAVVLLLRLGRLFRLFRLMVFIPNRNHMAEGIFRALRASVGVFLGILLLNLVLAVGASLLFGELAPEHFGTPFLSLYSLFKVFTVEGWYEIPDLLASRAQSGALALLARLYFVGAVLGGGILGLSLANAVFVDQMMMDNTWALESRVEELAREVRALRRELGRGGPEEPDARADGRRGDDAPGSVGERGGP